MGVRSSLIILITSLLIAPPAASQMSDLQDFFLMQPKSYEDCQDEKLLSYGPLQNAKSEAMACHLNPQNQRGPQKAHQCIGWTGASCTRAFDNECDLKDKLRREREICTDKVRSFLEAERIRKSQEAERDRDIAAAEEHAHSEMSGPEDVIRRMIDRAKRDGDYKLVAALAKRGAFGLGYAESPAQALSRAMTPTAMREFRRLTGFAQGELLKSLGSGAFDIDAPGAAVSGSGLPRGPGAVDLTSPDFASQYPPSSKAFEDLVRDWDSYSPVSQGVAIFSLVAQMIMIMKSDGPVNPSLLDGSFAANLAGMTESLISGELRVSAGQDPSDEFRSVQTASVMEDIRIRERNEQIDRALAYERQKAAEQIEEQRRANAAKAEEGRRQAEAEAEARRLLRLEEERREAEVRRGRLIRSNVPNSPKVTLNLMEPTGPEEDCGCLVFDFVDRDAYLENPGVRPRTGSHDDYMMRDPAYYDYWFSFTTTCPRGLFVVGKLIKSDGKEREFARGLEVGRGLKNDTSPIERGVTEIELISCNASWLN